MSLKTATAGFNVNAGPTDPEGLLPGGLDTAQKSSRLEWAGLGSVLLRTARPAAAVNDVFASGSAGIGYDAFPDLEDQSAARLQDLNGVPLVFARLHALAFHVRSAAEDGSFGGTVRIDVAGAAFAWELHSAELAAESIALAGLAGDGWEPDAGGYVRISFTPDGGSTKDDMTCLVEVCLLGEPAAP